MRSLGHIQIFMPSYPQFGDAPIEQFSVPKNGNPNESVLRMPMATRWGINWAIEMMLQRPTTHRRIL
jgi:hypothetical protein